MKKILIFELYTEEQSITTISNLLDKDFIVNIITSKKLEDFIEIHPKKLITFPYKNSYDFKKISEQIDKLDPDLIILPRFSAYSLKEFLFLFNLTKKYKTLVGISNYSRWFNLFPQLLKSDFPFVSLNSIKDWFFCRQILSNFKSFYVSEIEINSNNPTKHTLQNISKKHVFDIPFKYSNDTSSSINVETHIKKIFVIPGKIQKKRRDYFLVLNAFMSKELKNKSWYLYLLGRPNGAYGKKVIKLAKKINSSSKEQKIFFYDEYVSNHKYESIIKKSHFLIAPTINKTYKHGKDSGAIYDVIKYQKIGIFNEEIFAHSTRLIKDAVLTYKNDNEFRDIITNIMNDNLNINYTKSALSNAVNTLNKKNYRKSLYKNITKIINYE
jgi:hypothetical protein